MFYTQLIGRLGADAELKDSKSGSKYVTMRVASNDYVNGENVTTWTNVIWTGDRATTLQPYLKKGSLVDIHGILRVREYTTSEGAKGTSVDIMADRIDFVGGGKDTAQGTQSENKEPAPNAEEPAAKPKKAPAKKKEPVEEETDDLPF